MLERFRRGSLPPVEQRERIEGLERRLTHLEEVVEALEDAVHREWVRHDVEDARLERKTEPGRIARALSDDARRRGI
jgi:hypothetical protein